MNVWDGDFSLNTALKIAIVVQGRILFDRYCLKSVAFVTFNSFSPSSPFALYRPPFSIRWAYIPVLRACLLSSSYISRSTLIEGRDSYISAVKKNLWYKLYVLAYQRRAAESKVLWWWTTRNALGRQAAVGKDQDSFNYSIGSWRVSTSKVGGELSPISSRQPQNLER